MTDINNKITILDAVYWPYEKGTLVLPVTFYDTSDPPVAVTPNAGLTYSLTNFDGVPITGVTAIAITPASSVNIVLTGDALTIGEWGTDRELVISGTFNSSLANNLSLNQGIRFYIRPLAAIS
jgi:hypothetical protein